MSLSSHHLTDFIIIGLSLPLKVHGNDSILEFDGAVLNALNPVHGGSLVSEQPGVKHSPLAAVINVTYHRVSLGLRRSERGYAMQNYISQGV